MCYEKLALVLEPRKSHFYFSSYVPPGKGDAVFYGTWTVNLGSTFLLLAGSIVLRSQTLTESTDKLCWYVVVA